MTILDKIKADPFCDMKAELGKLLLKHKSSFTTEEEDYYEYLKLKLDHLTKIEVQNRELKESLKDIMSCITVVAKPPHCNNITNTNNYCKCLYCAITKAKEALIK